MRLEEGADRRAIGLREVQHAMEREPGRRVGQRQRRRCDGWSWPWRWGWAVRRRGEIAPDVVLLADVAELDLEGVGVGRRVGEHPPLESLRHQRARRSRHLDLRPERFGDGKADGGGARLRAEVGKCARHPVAGDRVVVAHGRLRVRLSGGVLRGRCAGFEKHRDGRAIPRDFCRHRLEIGVGREGVIRVTSNGHGGGLALLEGGVARLQPTGE